MSFRQFSLFLAASVFVHTAIIGSSIWLIGSEEITFAKGEHSITVKMIKATEKNYRVSKTKIASTIPASIKQAMNEAIQEQSANMTESGSVQLTVLYPEISRRRGEEGIVKLRVAVSKLGQIEDVIVLQSSGFQRLDAEAVRAARHLQGAGPGAKDFSVQFKLDDL